MTATTLPPISPAHRLGLTKGLRNTFTLTWRSVLLAGPAERFHPVVPDRARREREPRVGVDELGKRHEVAALERVEVAPRNRALLRRRVLAGRPIDPAGG